MVDTLMDPNHKNGKITLRPQKWVGPKMVIFGISVRSSIILYCLFLDSRDFFFQMRTVIRVLQRMPFKGQILNNLHIDFAKLLITN